MERLLDEGFQPKHVDRKALYVNFEERIKYLHEFLEFGIADVEALVTGAKYVKALIPRVVTLVYEKLLQRDITSRAFHTRSTAKGKPEDEDWLTEDTPQIQRRKMFLRWYLNRLCQDPTKMDFWRYIGKVGMMHSGQLRMDPLSVEYIHIGACIGYIQDVMIEAIMSLPQLSLRRKIALLRALTKVLWIQNDMFARWHVKDGDEFADEISLMSMEDGEKRMFGSSDASVSQDDDKSSLRSTNSTLHSSKSRADPSGVCPFANLGKASSTETKIWAN
ncbi:hypothetical protein N7474_004032 [Penicillium riverlandense]|uniref:uncharacterized protein n=1 Tax=Penicillium riverlandense TaxID=1903569 RepID=UPI00254799B2|nr:uncharacterized protein N7474_004032 [Penicillium riverlandense]KAJ5818441.1 hypothetical protein N7474_004032 [Penicillium riverlandense]